MLLQVLTTVLLISGAHCADQLPLVNTTLGEVLGFCNISHGGRKFSAFEGIPYAKPPIGERRFEKPEPVEPWDGIWDASYATQCAQTYMLEPNKTTGDEDCLHINVYVPREHPNPEENLDVIVHIHGGAYMYRSGNAYAHPDFLMDREIILVTFNYRLGILGFLSTEDDVVPGNNGLKDQTLALKWIQENITSFGGNPQSVTLTGASSGASSVHLHYLSDLSRGLFHRGFSQSGTALNPWSIQGQPLVKAKRLADAVGCPTNSTRILVHCLKQRPVKHLLDKLRLFFSYLFFPAMPFAPVVEKGGSKPFLNADPYYLLKTGKVYDVPWIASTTVHDGLFPVQYFVDDLDNIDKNWEALAPVLLEFNDTISPSQWKRTAKKIKKFYLGKESINKDNLMKFLKIFTDRYFVVGAETAVRIQSKVNKSPVYYYRFGYPGDKEKTVAHGVDVEYLFTPGSPSSGLTTNELKMSKMLIDMIIAFAKTEKPVFGDVDWKPTQYDQLVYLAINGTEAGDITLETAEDLTSENFWRSLQLSEGVNLLSETDSA